MSNLGSANNTDNVKGQFLAYDGNALLVPGQRKSFAVSFGGAFVTPQNVDVEYTKIDDVVTLHFPETISTAQADTLFTAADSIPEFLLPINSVNKVIIGEDNSAPLYIRAGVFLDGSISFGATAAFGDFTATGDCGFYGWSVTYKTTSAAS